MLAGNDPALDMTNTENNLEMKKEGEERQLSRMAKVHDLLEMRQGSQDLHATQNECHTQNQQITALGYIPDTEEIVEASWSLFQHDGAAAFKLSEKSPLPPGLTAKDLPRGRNQILNVHRIRTINLYAVKSVDDSATGSSLDTKHCLNRNGNLDNPSDSEDDCTSDNEPDSEQANGIEKPEYPEQRDVSAKPTVAGLNRPTWKAQRQVEKVLVTVNAMETRRNKGIKKR